MAHFWDISSELIKKYGQPPAVKFRLLVGYPEKPLDFREINIAMPGPEPDFGPFLAVRDSKGVFNPPPHFQEMLNRMRKDLNDKLTEFYFGPEKDK